jgi:hypothetical protein
MPQMFLDFPADPRIDLVLSLLREIQQELQTMSETDQQHADLIASRLNSLDAMLKSGFTAIQAEIASLRLAHPQIDFSGVDTAVTTLSTDVAATVAIPPAPTPVPAATMPTGLTLEAATGLYTDPATGETWDAASGTMIPGVPPAPTPTPTPAA